MDYYRFEATFGSQLPYYIFNFSIPKGTDVYVALAKTYLNCSAKHFVIKIITQLIRYSIEDPNFCNDFSDMSEQEIINKHRENVKLIKFSAEEISDLLREHDYFNLYKMVVEQLNLS